MSQVNSTNIEEAKVISVNSLIQIKLNPLNNNSDLVVTISWFSP